MPDDEADWLAVGRNSMPLYPQAESPKHWERFPL
jgi:hypothetical protein